ncbi:MAG: DUF4440 domain-containing protein [Acidobacteria bacterium]|nr:DUF4440 domain-containing protein [Acidobacteriota bacterium]
MKRAYFAGLATLVCLSASVVFAQASTPSAHGRFDPVVEGKALLHRDAEWAAAATAGKDVDKIVSYWSDDAVVIEPGEPPLAGKAAIRAYVTASLKTPGFTIHWMSRNPVFSADGSMAYMPGSEEITVPGADGKLVTLHLQGMSIWRRAPGGPWLCVADIATLAPQSAATP